MNDDIFIAIASFKDDELYTTVFDLVEKSDNPENLHFGIVHQYDNTDDKTSENSLDYLEKIFNVDIIKIPYEKSKGGCWARQKVQRLLKEQKYHLQIDSHTRMISGWDTMCKKVYNDLLKQSDKPIISFLPPSYFRNDKLGIDYEFHNINFLNKLNIPKVKFMSNEYWIDIVGYDNVKELKEHTQIPFLYGGFIFSSSEWVREIEQDPKHYYTGEEFALSIRSFTHGYDIYLPSKIMAWHRGNGENKPKHFTTLSDGKPEHQVAMKQLKKLIEGGDLGKYGLGEVRSLREYETFAHIDFENKKVNLNENIFKE